MALQTHPIAEAFHFQLIFGRLTPRATTELITWTDSYGVFPSSRELTYLEQNIGITRSALRAWFKHEQERYTQKLA